MSDVLQCNSTYKHTYFVYLYTVKSSVKKKLIKTTLFYKIAVWEPDWQLL